MADTMTEPKGAKPVRQDRMVQEAISQSKAERPYIASQEDWDKVQTPEFGGQADILQIAVGEVAGRFTYMGHQPMVLDGGKEITVHLGVDPSGDSVRLPIAASFLRAIDQAELEKGDAFLIRRSDDVRKKSGIGKGQAMQIYSIKVASRVPRTASDQPKF